MPMHSFIKFLLLVMLATSAATPGSGLADTPQHLGITLSGDAFYSAALVTENTDRSACGLNCNLEFMNRLRLRATAAAMTDDGLTYGALFRLRASLHTGIMDADQAYIFTKGKFGAVELGTQFNPAMPYHVTAPNNFGTGGVDGDWPIGEVGWIQNQVTFLEPYFGGGYTVTTFLKPANRINYLSPRFFSDGSSQSGLMGTLSYAPANRNVFTGVNRSRINSDPVNARPYGYGRTTAFSNCGGGSAPVGCNYSDVYEIGLRYDEEFHGVTVKAGAVYAGGSTAQTNFGALQSYYDLSAWQVGLQLGIAGFLVGGSYANAGKSAYPHESNATGRLHLSDQFTWTAGISYEATPFAVGFNYEYGRDAGDLTAPGARTANLFSVGLTYKIASGLTTAIEYLRSTTHNEDGFVTDPLGFRRASSGNANLYLWKTQLTF